MQEKRAKLNFDKNTLEIEDKTTVTTVNNLNTNEGLARTKKAVTIPKFSETLKSVSISHRKNGDTVLLEPLRTLDHVHIKAARSLVNIKNGKAFI